MLTELLVYNLAVIREIELSLDAGLNILSGETGAGKSILVGAVNLLLGGRASQEMIRTGAAEATVQGIFSLSDPLPWNRKLESLGIPASDRLTVRRSIHRNGRNRVFVNERMVSVQQLQQLARGLASVSGQHEHQLLLDPEIHLSLLDQFGSLDARVAEVGALFAQWARHREALHRLRRSREERAARADFVRFQLQELLSAKLQPEEDRSLEHELNLLKHAAALNDAAKSAYETLYSGRGAVVEQLASLEKNLDTLVRIDPGRASFKEHLSQARIHAEELAHALHKYAQQITFDPQRLSAVEKRLALLHRLGKKYGGSVEAMLRRTEELRKELNEAEDVGMQEEELQNALEEARRRYLEEAGRLSRSRREAADRLAAEVVGTLARLDMPSVRFRALFSPEDVPTDPGEDLFSPRGIDQVEFLLSANLGEDLKPLSKVASGGELSRILLSLKGLLGRKGDAETLIFDEVDAGIGGRTAELVGLQLRRLARKQQVICITHLPQIACCGDGHYRVAKETVGQETLTGIRRLSPEERIEELARMLGGIDISEKARAHAAEMLKSLR
mgnify:CR=1 FL=1